MVFTCLCGAPPPEVLTDNIEEKKQFVDRQSISVLVVTARATQGQGHTSSVSVIGEHLQDAKTCSYRACNSHSGYSRKSAGRCNVLQRCSVSSDTLIGVE